MGTLHSLAFPVLNLIKLPPFSFWHLYQSGSPCGILRLSDWVLYRNPLQRCGPVRTSAITGPRNSWAKGGSGYRNMERAPQLGLGPFGEDTAYLWCLCRERTGEINTASSFCSLVSSWCLLWTWSKQKTDQTELVWNPCQSAPRSTKQDEKMVREELWVCLRQQEIILLWSRCFSIPFSFLVIPPHSFISPIFHLWESALVWCPGA